MQVPPHTAETQSQCPSISLGFVSHLLGTLQPSRAHSVKRKLILAFSTPTTMASEKSSWKAVRLATSSDQSLFPGHWEESLSFPWSVCLQCSCPSLSQSGTLSGIEVKTAQWNRQRHWNLGTLSLITELHTQSTLCITWSQPNRKESNSGACYKVPNSWTQGHLPYLLIWEVD